MDCFYAAVEMRDNPAIRDKPVIVGGPPNSRGVVCTANYLARSYGIHSAMASSRAGRLCPQAIFMRPNFEKYRLASEKIHQVFLRYTDVIEPLSLDEAYLDVTSNKLGLYAREIAQHIRQDIFKELSLTASAGVGPNKLIAKIASDIRKPDGLTIVTPEQVFSFVSALSIRKIPGVGPKTEAKLKSLGFSNCRDITSVSPDDLKAKLGTRLASWLYQRCQGIDDRQVKPRSDRKSIGHEDTFQKDLVDEKDLLTEIARISMQVAKRLKSKSLTGKTITLKVKYNDFKMVTRSQTRVLSTNDVETIFTTAKQLMEKTDATEIPIRLLGISLSNLQKSTEPTSCTPLFRDN